MYGELTTSIKSQVKIDVKQIGKAIAVVATNGREEELVCTITKSDSLDDRLNIEVAPKVRIVNATNSPF